MWTEQQKKAIQTNNKNILVSAAAGSGKTAVLTERILQKLVTGETQADRLVVVTFTKAAAAEMRERIRRGLESRFKEDPSNKGLFVQMTLLADADICTIDSFCNKIVRTRFEEVGIDPAYRVAEEAELSLLKADVFSRVIEEFYREGEEAFIDFVSAFSSAKNDSDIEAIIDELYEESQNKPWPDEWLDKCLENSRALGTESDPLIYANVMRIRDRLEEYISGAREAVSMIYEGSGVEKYKAFMEGELDGLERICALVNKLKTGNESALKLAYKIYEETAGFEFATLPRAAKDADEAVKGLCKGFRDAYKRYVTRIVPRFKDTVLEGEDDFYLIGRISKGDAEYIRRCTEIIINITKRFTEELEAEKKKRNLVTFADIEHMALDILVKKEGGRIKQTAAAEELKDFYHEILTDEYQDSNALQEAILQAIARDDNRYMVGDVKQSIYGFRGGEPRIFLNKYDAYRGKESGCPEQTRSYPVSEGQLSESEGGTCIILQNNFRSRSGVLNACNMIFSALMHKEYTGISYDKSEWLVPAFEFEEYDGEGMTFTGENGRVSCEVILTGEEEFRENSRIEGLRIAEMIKGYVNAGCKVYDTKKKCYRPLTYRDVVVLTRTTGYGAAVAEALNDAGVPAYAESTSVYTDTYEVRPVMSFLKCIDNPLDDISFTALMMSFFGGFTADEVAVLRAERREEFFYRGLEELCDDVKETKSEITSDSPIYKKTWDFLQKVRGFREASSHLSVYDLMWNIIYETGYYSYISSVPGATRRLANLDLLLNRAFMFTGTSYNGLFQFLRYMERIEETDKGVGEISAVSELQDVVRVMTIHKSKGLEFPVVFLAGMEKRMNLTDATDRKKIIINDEFLATDVYDTKRRVKRTTAYKKSLQAQIRQRGISEEIRLLYVALTRAVEKLHIIGTCSGDDLTKAAGDAVFFKTTGNFGICDLDSASDYFKLLLPVIISDEEKGGRLFDLAQTLSANVTDPDPFDEDVDHSDIIFYKDERDQGGEEANGQKAQSGRQGSDKYKKTETNEKEQEIIVFTGNNTYHGYEKPVKDIYIKYNNFIYPYEDEIHAKPKVTVTELKRMSYADEAEAALDYRETTDEPEAGEEYSSFSEFTSEPAVSAAGRGTIYHKLLEHLDPGKCSNADMVESQIKKLTEAGVLDHEAAAVVNPEDIVTLAASEIGKRAAAALKEGRGKREQQFMMGVDVEGRSEALLVQGVMDMWFEESDGLVVVDYKTDKVSRRGGGKVLKKRYAKQLEIYADALSRATGKPVKECVIYSFGMGKEVKI